jgi:hypothetical protein
MLVVDLGSWATVSPVIVIKTCYCWAADPLKFIVGENSFFSVFESMPVFQLQHS